LVLNVISLFFKKIPKKYSYKYWKVRRVYHIDNYLFRASSLNLKLELFTDNRMRHIKLHIAIFCFNKLWKYFNKLYNNSYNIVSLYTCTFMINT